MRKHCTLALTVAVVILSSCQGGALPNAVRSSDDLHGRTIGVLADSASVRFAEELGTVWLVHSETALLSDLRQGRIDAALMGLTAAQAAVLRQRGVEILSGPLVEYDMRIAVARENAQLLVVVNSALAMLEENGTLPGLRGKHFREESFEYIPPKTSGTRPGSLTIAVPAHFPPYVFTQTVVIGTHIDEYGDEHPIEEQELAGFVVDVARAVADIIGIRAYIFGTDPDNLINAVWFGHADLSLGHTPWDDGDIDVVNFSNAYSRGAQVIIVRR